MTVATIRKNAREEIRVSVEIFKGQELCNVRVWFSDGVEMRPGKQGLAVRLALLPELVVALQLALGPKCGAA